MVIFFVAHHYIVHSILPAQASEKLLQSTRLFPQDFLITVSKDVASIHNFTNANEVSMATTNCSTF
jgi:hypothetical protein